LKIKRAPEVFELAKIFLPLRPGIPNVKKKPAWIIYSPFIDINAQSTRFYCSLPNQLDQNLAPYRNPKPLKYMDFARLGPLKSKDF